MNKKEFYDAFKKGFTCAITCLIIFFSGIFCFYTGYKFGCERVLDSDLNIVNTSSVQTKSIGLQPMDTVNTGWSFTSNSFTIPVSFFSDYGEYVSMYSNDFSFLNFSVNIGFDNNGLYFSYMTNSLYCLNKDVFLSPLSTAPDYTAITNTFHFVDTNQHDFWQSFGYAGVYHFVVYKFDSGFGNSPISYVNISKNLTNQIFGRFSGVDVRFYDGNGKALLLRFLFSNNDQGDLVPERNIYVLENLTDNDYYNAGYDAGYNVGENNGIQLGYNDGYSVGDRVGYNRGYDAGINAGTQYSFSSLLTAVIDAPVQVFIGLLNFDIMGYNLLNLFVGLLTFAIIVLILKLILGGK